MIGTPPRDPRRRSWWLAVLLLLPLVEPTPSDGQARPKAREWVPPASLHDPRLEMIRMASESWDLRAGPRRAVVDQVCLVPDVATFFEAIATWDDSHYFPILIDDVESTFRFLRAFRPARIVRYPKAAAPIGEGKTWERAVAAVAGSWTPATDPGSAGLAGDAVPTRLGPTPPGVVLSSPSAPMLAGAVALAAGRFQPLIRLDYPRRFGDFLTAEELKGFDLELTAKVRERVPNYERLGDGCDFLTVAGDWPYRYKGPQSREAVDDAIGRLPGSGARWAFAGRLLGGPALSVYRAMCSLFLQPQSAAMFNCYETGGPPWSDYAMKAAAARMSGLMPTAHYWGDELGSIGGWHELFQAGNRSGLLLVNSSGSPSVFNIRRGPGGTPDTPRTVPTALFIIHSFSAAEPNDPSTIAGRWLANGAFVYYGAMDEPFLQSFRTPNLVGDLIGEGLPMVAAARATLAEPYGTPWRLVYLGDPLYRLKAKNERNPRLASWEPVARWPSYAVSPRTPAADEGETLRWALKTALARLQGAAPTPAAEDSEVIDVLLEIRRSRLPADLRPIHDALLADLLFQSRRRGELRSRIAAIPESGRTPDLRRWYDTILAADLQWAISRKDFARARSVWAELIRIDLPRDYKESVTKRVGGIAETPLQMHDWSLALRAAIRERPKSVEGEALAAELKRFEQTLRALPSSSR